MSNFPLFLTLLSERGVNTFLPFICLFQRKDCFWTKPLLPRGGSLILTQRRCRAACPLEIPFQQSFPYETLYFPLKSGFDSEKSVKELCLGLRSTDLRLGGNGNFYVIDRGNPRPIVSRLISSHILTVF